MSTESVVYEASNSEIQTFLRCRRKWWLSYPEGWRPRPSPAQYLGPLAIGSRVHKALEMFYKKSDDPLITHALLLDQARIDMGDDGFALDKLDSEGELGRLMLEGYQEWVDNEGLDADVAILGVEEILKADVLPGRMRLIGKIDLRIQRLRDDTRAVLDFKTSANFDDFTATAHMAPQLLSYMTLDHASGDPRTRVDGGIYRLLRKVKRGPRAVPPFYRELTIRHNVFFLRSFWRRLQGTLTQMYEARRALENGEAHQFWAYPTPTRTCSWDCAFLRICPMFDDGSGVEHALADEYVRGDPYDYYRSEDE
jgi:RecB family exonuclease